jgi:hypothetical protein
VTDVESIEDIGPVPLGGGKAASDLIEHRLEATKKLISECCEAVRVLCADSRSLLHDASSYSSVHGYEVEQTQRRLGRAAEKLLPLADNSKADLIIMGDSARRLLLRKVMGDAALEVINQSVLPVFLSH